MMVETASLDDLTETPREVAFPGSEPKTVWLTLAAGEAVPAHRHPDREIVVHAVSGRLDVRVDGESNVLDPGDLLRFDGRREVSRRPRRTAPRCWCWPGEPTGNDAGLAGDDSAAVLEPDGDRDVQTLSFPFCPACNRRRVVRSPTALAAEARRPDIGVPSGPERVRPGS